MTRRAGGIKTIFTDHYSVEVKIVSLPKSKAVKEKEKTWNLLKIGGREKYKQLTKKAAEKVKRVAVVQEYLTIFPDYAKQENHLSPVVIPLPSPRTSRQTVAASPPNPGAGADKESFSPGHLLTPRPKLADKESSRPGCLYPSCLGAEAGQCELDQ